jgi:hypothetical protein
MRPRLYNIAHSSRFYRAQDFTLTNVAVLLLPSAAKMTAPYLFPLVFIAVATIAPTIIAASTPITRNQLSSGDGPACIAHIILSMYCMRFSVSVACLLASVGRFDSRDRIGQRLEGANALVVSPGSNLLR